MHILVVPSWYGTLENPLSGIFFRKQAEALREAGHQVGVLTSTFFSIKSPLKKGLLPAVEVTTENEIPVYRVRQRYFAFLNRAIFRLYSLSAYQRYVREQGRPDLLHAHSILLGGYVAVEIKAKDGLPVVITEHSSAFLRRMIKKNSEGVIRYTLEHADRVFAVSQVLAQALQSYYPRREVEVLGNLVDGEFFTLAPPALNSDRPFTFANVSILAKNKGVDILLRAFAMVCQSKNARLRIAGGGPELGNLQVLAGQLGIRDRVEFLGQLDHIGVRNLLHESDALVLSSLVETFGVVLIEALACGKPVVATRCGGPQDIVNDANGLLVPTSDSAALADGLVALMDQYAKYHPARIRADCLNRFGKTSFISKQVEIYQSVLKG